MKENKNAKLKIFWKIAFAEHLEIRVEAQQQLIHQSKSVVRYP